MTSINATAFLLLLLPAAFLLLHIPATHAGLEPTEKKIYLTNNHTNFLSVRCFSFDDEYEVVHLAPWQQFMFKVKKRVVYPSATMFNCSTNMGTFIAFKYNYECSEDKYDICNWRFDEDSAYRWEPKSSVWATIDYAPNYESLDRGGVVKGYFAN